MPAKQPILGEIIAERILQTDESPPREVKVQIARPVLRETGEYECVYSVSGSGISRIQVARGLDGIQALQRAFVMLSGEVRYLELQNGFKLMFSDSPNCGFPDPYA